MSIYVVYTGDTNITKSSKMTLKLKLNCFTLYEYTPGVNDSDIDPAKEAFLVANAKNKEFIVLNKETNKYSCSIARISKTDDTGVPVVIKTQIVPIGSNQTVTFAIGDIDEAEINKLFPYDEFIQELEALQPIFELLN